MNAGSKDKTILIVEDDREMQSILQMYLSKLGYTIKMAENGEDAFRQIRHSSPDLILSDIMMPGQNGLEFRNRLLKNPEYRMIPFIFLTALGRIEEKISGFKLFVDDYIVKPFEMAELVVRVESTLKRSEYYNELIKIDSLTQLYNRKAFYRELDKEIRRVLRYKTNISIAIIDIDHFKNCNDTYGHSFGDTVLSKISKLMISVLRETDFAGRYGGEEFLIAMPQTSKESAKRVIDRLRKSIEKMKFNQPGFSVTMSAGVATIPDDAKDSDDVVKTADIALYRAKNGGRNRVEVFDKSNEPTISI